MGIVAVEIVENGVTIYSTTTTDTTFNTNLSMFIFGNNYANAFSNPIEAKLYALKIWDNGKLLNIHPSLLPKYRGASPIESAILNGDNDFSVSVMKLVKAMDAGPVYYQTTISNLPMNKAEIYKALSEAGAKWIAEHITDLPTPVDQDESGATFTEKLDKSMSKIKPDTETAEAIYRKIVAFQGFPKTKYTFYGLNCIILEAHILKQGETALIELPCKDGALSIDRLQPESKKPMDAKSFLNGYAKN